MDTVIIVGADEKSRFVPREMGDGYLVTPPRTRPWPVAPGDRVFVVSGKKRRPLGMVVSCRRVQFQRCRIEFEAEKKSPRKSRRAHSGSAILASLPARTARALDEAGFTTDGAVIRALQTDSEGLAAALGISTAAFARLAAAYGEADVGGD